MSFPAFSMFHAHGEMTTTFATPCNNLSTIMTNELNNFQDPSNGLYQKVQETENYFWFTRTTPVKHYVDDVSFALSDASTSTCTVTAKSQSQVLSVLDYGTNYCNMFNVIRMAGVNYTTPQISNFSNSSNVPTDIITTCNKY